MEEAEYRDNEKVLYRTKVKLSIPKKEDEEVDCLVTEGHVFIEAGESIEIPLLRIKDMFVHFNASSYLSVETREHLASGVTLTFLDDSNKKHRLSLETIGSHPTSLNEAIKEAKGKQKGEKVERGDEISIFGVFLFFMGFIWGGVILWAILHALDGIYRKDPFWGAISLGVFVPLMAGLGALGGWGWVRKVSFRVRLASSLAMSISMATLVALVILGHLGSGLAAAILMFLLFINWFRTFL